jgi:hypothetical protein
MPAETPDVWDEINRWAELLRPIDEPRPVCMEVGPAVVTALRERFTPALNYVPAPAWRSTAQLFGVPIAVRYVLAPDYWRLLDQFRKVMAEGLVHCPQY